MALSIDALLEQYLSQLDLYTQLQSQLATAQKTTFQQLARANWAAQGGIRYGADFYDERMRAMRLVEVIGREEAGVKVRVVKVADRDDRGNNGSEAKENEIDRDREKTAGNVHGEAAADITNRSEVKSENADAQEGQTSSKSVTAIDLRNPLRWFGLLVPPALRAAQSQAITTVDSIIPQLINVRCDLRQLEIEIGRARKQRARAHGRNGETDGETSGKETDVAEVADTLQGISLVGTPVETASR
ncbi:hypothetical protein Cpir12675_003919 [Ceratocystis pirilliformis]|uniref:Vacuolar ATPase assembly protein VMA22 n=1 Tax=Ceratocystis pirilliformis TaxID=259994 RepID=A0ABR3YZS5_9PEZI